MHVMSTNEEANQKWLMYSKYWSHYHEMQCLPMGLSNSPDIFQEKMSELMYGLENVRAYIDDLLVISKGTFTEHLADVDQVLKQLRDAGLKVNDARFARIKASSLTLGLGSRGLCQRQRWIVGSWSII